MNDRLAQLCPYFEEQDYHIYNCNPESKLTAFDHLPFEEALKRAQADFGNIDLEQERSLRLYDHTSKQKRRGTGKNLIARKRKAARKRTTKKS